MTWLRRIAIGLGLFIGLLVIAVVVWWWRPTPTKLVGAASRGDLKTMRFYLFCGADPNAFGKWGWYDADGQTPLTAAAQHGQVDAVRLLMEQGADLNRLDSGIEYPHNTPLAVAAMHGQLEICLVLLDAGADPNVPNSPRQAGNMKNWTALDWALQAKHEAIADLIRQRGGKESEYRASYLKDHPRTETR